MNIIHSLPPMWVVLAPGTNSPFMYTAAADEAASKQMFITANKGTWEQALTCGFTCQKVAMHIEQLKPATVKPADKNPADVRIINEELCRLHGWLPRGVVPVQPREIQMPDSNGYDIYVTSKNFTRSVKLSPADYELCK